MFWHMVPKAFRASQRGRRRPPSWQRLLLQPSTRGLGSTRVAHSAQPGPCRAAWHRSFAFWKSAGPHLPCCLDSLACCTTGGFLSSSWIFWQLGTRDGFMRCSCCPTHGAAMALRALAQACHGASCLHRERSPVAAFTSSLPYCFSKVHLFSLFERHRQTDGEKPSTCRVTPQMSPIAQAGAGQSQETLTASGCPM